MNKSSHPSFRTPIRKFAPLAFSLALLALAGTARAASYTYTLTNTSGTDTWSSGANWNAVPQSSSTTVLNFGAGTPLSGTANTIDNDTGSTNGAVSGVFSMSTLNLGGTGAAGVAAVVNIFGSAGTSLDFVNGAGATVNLNAMAGAGGSFTYNIGNNITLGNSITINGSGNAGLNLGGIINGAGSITLNDANTTLTISGSDTAGGIDTINAGSFLLSGTINSTGAVNLNGGTFSETSNSLLTGASENLAVSGGVAFLAGVNTYTSTTALNSGSIQLSGTINGSSAININGGLFTETSSGVIAGSSSISISGGNMILNGNNTDSGSVNLLTGTLTLNFAGATSSTNILGSGETLGFGSSGYTSGGSLVLVGASTGTSSQTVNAITVHTAGGYGSIIFNPNGGALTTLQSTGILTIGASAAEGLNFDYSQGTTVGASVGNVIASFASAQTLHNGIIGAPFTVTDSGGAGFATYNGANQVIRLVDNGSSGLPVASGTTTANYFINQNYSTSSTGTPGSLVEALSGNVAANSVTVDTTGLTSGANLALGNNVLTLSGALGTGGAILFSGSNPYTITATGAGGLAESVASGGGLVMDNFDSNTVTINAPLLLSGATVFVLNGPGTTVLGGSNSFGGATFVNSGTLVLTGTLGNTPINIGAPASVNETATGLISGTASFSIAGNASLGSANTYTGATTINSGVLTLGNALAVQNSLVTVNANNGLAFNGGLTGTNAYLLPGLAGSAAGNVVLTDGSTGAAVNLVINISNSTAQTYSGSFSGVNGSLLTNSGTGTGSQTLGVLGSNFATVTENSATSELILTGSGAFGSLAVLSGTAFSSTGGTITNPFGSGTITLGSAGNSATLMVNHSETVGNNIVTTSGSAGALIITNAAGGLANYSGAITLNGTNTLSLIETPSANAGITLSGGVSGTGNLLVTNNGAAAITLSTGTFNNTGAITNSGTGVSIDVISGVLGSNVTNIVQNSANSSLSISGVNNGAGGFGSGPGTVTITTGTLTAGGTGALGSGNTVFVGTSGVLSVASSVTIGGLDDLSGPGGTVTFIGTSGKVLTLGGTNAYSFSGVITGTSVGLNVALTGNGSQTLSGTLTYGSPTTVTSGTLVLTGTLSNTPITVNGGVLNETSVGAVSGTSSLTVAGGLGTISGSNSYSGATTVSSGTLNLAGSLNNTTGVTVNGANAVFSETSAGSVNGGATFTVNNATATATLNGTNAYTGITTVTAGTLIATNNASGLGNNSGVALNGGKLSLLNNGAGNNGTIIYTGTASPAGYNVSVSGATSVINVDNNGSNTGNTVQLGALTMTNATLTVTNGDAYNLLFSGAAIASANSFLTNNMVSGTTTLTSLQAGDAGAGRTFTFNGTSASAVTSVGAITQSGTTAGTLLSVTQSGAGTLILTASNFYNGATTVSAGTLNETSSGVISGGASFILTAGAATLAGNNTYSGGTTLTAGTLALNSNGALGGGTFSLNGGVIVNTSGAPVTETNNPVIVDGASFTLGAAGDSGSSGNINFGTGGISFSNARTITLANTGGGATFTFGTLTGGAAAETNTFNGAGNTLVFGGYNLTSPAGGAANDVVTGNANVTFTGAIVNGGTNATANGFGYSGSGTLTLAGASTYTGATTIAGNVILTGSLGATAVAVNGGGTLGGTGVIGTTGTTTGGTVTVAGGATAATQGSINLTDGQIGTLTIRGNTSGGTFLTIGNASAGTTSNLTFETGTNSVDSIAVTNSGKMTLNAGGATINLTALAGQSLNAGTYNLITSSSNTYTGVFSLGTSIQSGSLRYLLNSATNAEQLIVAQGAGATAYWTGANGANWDTVSPTTNFSSDAAGLTPTGIPISTTNVIFAATSGSNLATSLDQNDFSINSLTFISGSAVSIGGTRTLTLVATGTNGITDALNSGADTLTTKVALGSSQTWEIDSTNALVASGVVSDGGSGFGLAKTGLGTLILGGNDTYTGATTISSGTLQIGNAGTTGSLASASIVDNSALAFNEITTALTEAAVISGSGTVTQAGTDVVSLTSSNSYTGATADNGGGTLRLSGSLGSVDSSAVTVSNGSTLTFDSSTAGVAGATRAPSVNLSQGTLSVLGNSGVNSVDAITGALTISGTNGFTDPVTLTPNAATNTQLTASSLVRTNHGVALFAATNLGAATIASGSANSANISFGSAPALVGGGGAAGSTNVSIIPWAIGDTSAAGTGSTFVTYTAANGIRTLNASEFANSVTDGSTTTNNVLLNGGTNTFNSNTTFNSLIVDVPGTTVVSGSGTLTVTSGAVLFNPTNSGSSFTFSNTLNFGTAEGVIGVAYNRNLTIGPIAGSGGLTLYDVTQNSPSGAVTLGGGDTYTGDTTILGFNFSLTAGNALPDGNRTGDVYVYGELRLGTGNIAAVFNGLDGNGTVIYGNSPANSLTLGDNNANGNFSGVLNNAGSSGILSLTKIGSGTQTLSGANITSTSATQTDTTSMNGGTLLLDFSAAGAPATNILDNNGSTRFTTAFGGGTLALKGLASATNSQALLSTAVNAGNSALVLNAAASNPLSVTMGAITRNTGGTIDFTLPSGSQNSINGILTSSTANLANNILVSAAANGIAYATVNGGTDWASLSGSNIVGFSTVGSYATGNASYTKNNNVDVTNGDTFLTSGTANTLRFNAATDALTLSGTDTVGTGGILVTAASTNASITSGTISGGAGKELVIIDDGALTVNSVIGNNGTATALTLSGTGTTTLTGSNTYTGLTYVNGATVISSDSNLGAVATGAQVNMNGGTLKTSGTFALDNNGSNKRAIVLGNNGGTFDVTSGGNLTISGIISGGAAVGVTDALTKTDAGTLTLTGSSSYASNTIINGGTVIVAKAGNLGTASGGTLASNLVSINNGGTLLVSASNALGTNSAVTLNGGTFKSAANEGSGASVTGATYVPATLTASGGTPTGTNTQGMGALTLTAASTLDFGATANTQVFGSFSDPTGAILNVIDYTTTTTNIGLGTSGVDGTDDRLIFNVAGGLTTAQLADIQFNGAGGAAQINLGGGFYEVGVAPVPEPATILAGLLVVGFVGFRERRRLSGLRARLAAKMA